MECRTIFILSHASKLSLGIIKDKIKNKMEQYVSEDQLVFDQEEE